MQCGVETGRRTIADKIWTGDEIGTEINTPSISKGFPRDSHEIKYTTTKGQSGRGFRRLSVTMFMVEK